MEPLNCDFSGLKWLFFHSISCLEYIETKESRKNSTISWDIFYHYSKKFSEAKILLWILYNWNMGNDKVNFPKTPKFL